MAGDVKLSKAQLAVLERMATGDEVWTTSGRAPSAFWHGDLTAKQPAWATLHALRREELIEDTEDEALRWRGAKYRITETGRAATRSQP